MEGKYTYEGTTKDGSMVVITSPDFTEFQEVLDSVLHEPDQFIEYLRERVNEAYQEGSHFPAFIDKCIKEYK